MSLALWDTLTVVVALGGLVTLWTAILRERRRAARTDVRDVHDTGQRRRDMIYIWTELHGVPHERAEAMYEEYERASAAGSMGLKCK